MALDKELYRKAYQLYREWNEEELRWRVRNAGKLSPQEGWKRYVDLWEFTRQIHATPGWWQEREKSEALERYYDRIEKIERWRQALGRKS